MTPKEKAQELYERYCNMDSHCDDAIECALIAVEELINVAQDDIHFIHTDFTSTHANYKSYWRLVKEEILNL